MHNTNTHTGEGMKEARLLALNQPQPTPQNTPQNSQESNIFVRQENERADMFEDKYDRVYDRMEQRLGEYRARTEELTTSLDDAYEGETEQAENADDSALQEYKAKVEEYARATRAAYTRMESGMYAKLDDIEANYSLAEAVIANLDAKLATQSGEPAPTYEEEVRTRRVEQTLSSGSVKSVDLHTSKDNFRSVDVRPSTYLVRLPSDFKLSFVGAMPANAATVRSASNGVQYLSLTEEGAMWLDGKTVEMTTGTGETVRAMVSRTASEYGNVLFTFEKPAEPEPPTAEEAPVEAPRPEPATEEAPVEAPRPEPATEEALVEATRPEPAEVPEVTPEPPATEEVPPVETPKPEPATEEANESTEVLTQKFVNAVNELEIRAMGDNKDYVSKQLETVNNILQSITNPDQKMVALEAAGLVSSSPNSETGRTERTATPRTIIRSLEGETAQTPVTIGTNIDFNAVFLEYGETQESVETLKENLSEAVTQLKNFLEGGFESQADDQVNVVNAAYKEIPTEISAETIAELGLDVGVEADGSMNSGNIYVISLDAKTNSIGYAVKGAEQASEESLPEPPTAEDATEETDSTPENIEAFDDIKDAVENLRQQIYGGKEVDDASVVSALADANTALDLVGESRWDATRELGLKDGISVTNSYNKKEYVISCADDGQIKVEEAVPEPPTTEAAPEAVDQFADLKDAVENLRQQIYGGKEVDDASVVDALHDVNDAFTAIPAEMDREDAIDAAGLRDGVNVTNEYNDKTYAIAYDTATDSIVLKDVVAEESPPKPPANEEQGDTPEDEKPTENLDQQLAFARNRFNMIKGMLDQQKATFDADGTQKSLDTFRNNVQDAIANRRAQIAERVGKGVDPANDPVISELRDQIISLQNDYLQPYAGKSGTTEEQESTEDTPETAESLAESLRDGIKELKESIALNGVSSPKTTNALTVLNNKTTDVLDSWTKDSGPMIDAINAVLADSDAEAIDNAGKTYSINFDGTTFSIEDVTVTPPKKDEDEKEKDKEEDEVEEKQEENTESEEKPKESTEVDPEMKEMLKKIQDMLDALMKMMEELQKQRNPESSQTPPTTPETPSPTPSTPETPASPEANKETLEKEIAALEAERGTLAAEWKGKVSQGYDALRALGEQGFPRLDAISARVKQIDAEIAAKREALKALESVENLPNDLDQLLALRSQEDAKLKALVDDPSKSAEARAIEAKIRAIDTKLVKMRADFDAQIKQLENDPAKNDEVNALRAKIEKIDAVVKAPTATPSTPENTETTESKVETLLKKAMPGVDVRIENGNVVFGFQKESAASNVLTALQFLDAAAFGTLPNASIVDGNKKEVRLDISDLTTLENPLIVQALATTINTAVALS